MHYVSMLVAYNHVLLSRKLEMATLFSEQIPLTCMSQVSERAKAKQLKLIQSGIIWSIALWPTIYIEVNVKCKYFIFLQFTYPCLFKIIYYT